MDFFDRCTKMVVCGIEGGLVGGAIGVIVCAKNCNPNPVIIKTFFIGGACVGVVYGYYYEPEDFNDMCGEAMNGAFNMERQVPVSAPANNPAHKYNAATGQYMATNLPPTRVQMVPSSSLQDS